MKQGKLSDFGDVKDLELNRAELDEAIKNFNASYHSQLEDQTEIDDSQEYYDVTLLLANDTRRIIDDWIQVGFKQPQGEISQPNLQPEDSITTLALWLPQSLRPDLRPACDPREVVQCLVLELQSRRKECLWRPRPQCCESNKP